MSAANEPGNTSSSLEGEVTTPPTDGGPLTEVARSQLQPDQPIRILPQQLDALPPTPEVQVAVPELGVLPATPPLEVVNGPVDVEAIPASSDPGSARVDVEPLEDTFGLPYAWLGTITPEVPPTPSSSDSADPWGTSAPPPDPVELGSPTTRADLATDAVPAGAGNFEYPGKISYPGKIDGKISTEPHGPPLTTIPPGRVDYFRERDAAGNVIDRDIPGDDPVDASKEGAAKPVPKPERIWQVAAALGLILTLTFGAVLFFGQSQPLDPAAAIASGMKSDPPGLRTDPPGLGGGVASVDPGESGTGATPRTDANPGLTSSTGGQPTALPVPTPKPTPKPTPNPSNAAEPTKSKTPDVQPTKPPIGEIKVTPTLVKATCQGAIEPFDLVIDNTSGPFNVAWTIEVGPGPSGPWAAASATVGSVVPGQLKVVIVTPGDFCKALTGTTTFELTVKLNGNPTLVSYEVSP